MITVDGHDALASGAIWVTASGIVLRTRLELDDPSSRIKVTTIVTYGRDPKLAGWFPMRMDETYVKGFGTPTAPPAAPDGLLPARPVFAMPFSDHISCVATYSNYRRFETSARIVDHR